MSAHWRAPFKKRYWYVADVWGTVSSQIDWRRTLDNNRYASLNYFRYKYLVVKYLRACRKAVRKIHTATT